MWCCGQTGFRLFLLSVQQKFVWPEGDKERFSFSVSSSLISSHAAAVVEGLESRLGCNCNEFSLVRGTRSISS